MNRNLLLNAVLLGLMRCWSAWAADSTNVTVVTPEFVNRLAEEMRASHPALRAAWARTNTARLNFESVRAWEDPMVMVGGMAADTMMRASEGDLLYGVEQKLPLFGKPRLARHAAQAELATAQADADYWFQTLRRDLAIALFQAALAERTLEIGAEDLVWLETATATAEQQYRLGQAPQSQALRLQGERARRRAELTTEEQNRAKAWTSLNRLLSRDLLAPWPKLGLPAIAGPIVYSEQLADLSVRLEPRLQVLQRRVKEAETAVELTRRGRYPDLSVGTEVRNYTGNGDFRQAMVTLSFNLPWLNATKYRRAIQREQAKVEAAAWEAKDYAQGVREETRRLTLELDAARREALLYRDEILPRLEQALASTQAAWSANRGMFLEALEARRALIDARLTLARATAEQYRVLSELVLCCGLGDLEALYRFGAAPPMGEKEEKK
jgi:outer membrane protein TolC